MSVKPIPEHYHSVTPHLHVPDSAAAIDFYAKAFRAKELMRFPGPGGKIIHAEIRIGDSTIMMADEMPEWGTKSPKTLGGVTSSLMIYVEDCDAVFNQAIAAGATVMRPMENQFYGDRSGTVIDPFGHTWSIATHIEDVTPEEMDKRMAAWNAAQK